MSTIAAPSLTAGPFAGLLARRDRTITLAVALIFVVYALIEFWNNWAVDFSAYYYAGHFFHAGLFDQVYAGPPEIIGPDMPLAWEQAVAADGFAGEQTYPFIYMPWVAWAMAPVAAHVPVMVAMNAVLVVNIALSLASAVLAWRIFAPATNLSLGIWMILSAAILMISSLSALALSLGQIQIPVFALVLFAFERYRAGRSSLAGLLLAGAVLIKITPAAFAIIFLWDRNWRALATFLAAVATLFAGSVAVAGWELHATYFDIMGRLNGVLFMSNIGASLEAFLYQLVDAFQGTAPLYATNEVSVPRPAWLDPTVKGIFVAGLVAIWAATRRLPDTARVPHQLFALAILLPLCAPQAGVHYYLLAALMLPALFARRGLVTSLLFYGFLASTTMWAMYFMVTTYTVFMIQVMIYVPFFVALLARVLAHGAMAGDEGAPA